MACLRSSFSPQRECRIEICQREKSPISSGNLSMSAGMKGAALRKVQLRILGSRLRRKGRSNVFETRAARCVVQESSESSEIAIGRECGRRLAGMALVGTLLIYVSNQREAKAAQGSGPLEKYIKRKKLDPLETYVPTILLAQSQIQEVDGKLEGESSKFADARSLLRNGPAASLRTDIRAVAQYAAEAGNDGGATAAVDQCLSALEDLDSLLFQASRSQSAPVEKMKQRVVAAVTALDRLLATVPAPILEKGRAVAKAYNESE